MTRDFFRNYLRSRTESFREAVSNDEYSQFLRAVLGQPAPASSTSLKENAAKRSRIEFVEVITGAPSSNAATQSKHEEFLAAISHKHSHLARPNLYRTMADPRNTEEASLLSQAIHEGEWNPAKHPRLGGAPNAGWFASTGGGGDGAEGGGDQLQSQPSSGPLSSDDLWKAAKVVSAKRGTPTAMLDWNRSKGTRIDHDDYAYYSSWKYRIYLRKSDTHGIHRAADNPTFPFGLGGLHNEAFHSWYHRHGQRTWYGDLVNSQKQYKKGDVRAKSEEAASEMVDSVIGHIEATGTKPPSYEDAVKSNRINLSPRHNDPSEKWHEHPDAKLPINEELYYATLWVMYNGSQVPSPDASGSRLPALKKWYSELKDPGKPKPQGGADEAIDQ